VFFFFPRHLILGIEMGHLSKVVAAAAMAVGLAGAAAAHANTLFQQGAAFGPAQTDTSAFAFFGGVAGAAQASFSLDGYTSLDGQNFYEDDFTLSLNGNPVLMGTWSMGGGGSDVVFFSPIGATFSNISAPGVTFAGGHVLISTPLSLAGGSNTLLFAYDSLPAPGHAGFQGLGDEGWGVSNLLVTQAGTPEPLTWSLMIMGFGAAGAMLRRARQLATA
jgi:hypothetical protein